jgi:hypothetical protein
VSFLKLARLKNKRAITANKFLYKELERYYF